ncbi:MAG: 30S ribosome-binding factor RbfA [Candidatus Moraniibacteriota bacterium]|nr:MAG: 30S ribosome-binding factor RbfA [Candidatus Moranbacteria bacterium]
MSLRRIEKINEVINREVSDILKRDFSLDSEIFCTIIKVDTSPDLKHSKVHLSIYPEKRAPSFLKRLSKQKDKIEKKLFSKLCMRIVPKIDFIYNKTEQKADHIEYLLKRIHDEQQS